MKGKENTFTMVSIPPDKPHDGMLNHVRLMYLTNHRHFLYQVAILITQGKP